MIQIVGPRLSQWDTGRSISVSNSNATEAHIANRGDSHAPIMQITDGEVKIPDYLLQTGKDLCVYLVLDGITQESNIFSVQKRPRPENYVYEDDRRNYIYALITDAQAATYAANMAAETANAAAGLAEATATNAAQTANLAAANADTAANSAIAAAGKVDQAVNTANVAAANANDAAAKAEHTAKALMIVGGAGGTNISLNNAIDQFLVGLRICGKTTQNGTPTPENPVDLVSVGSSGSITVNVAGKSAAQSMTLATPNGLPGIPVTTGGNYIDSSGQRWLCDEKDYGRGVYIQRAYRKIVSNFVPEKMSGGTRYTALHLEPAPHPDVVECLCCSLPFSRTVGTDSPLVLNGIRIAPGFAGGTVVARWNDMVLNNLDVMYALATPIETPLSEAELAAYAALHTYRGNTTVTNDAGAHMELEYVMDAKKYIDSQISAGILAATVE